MEGRTWDLDDRKDVGPCFRVDTPFVVEAAW